MNEQAIDEIKNALREMMQLLVQRNEPLSDELKLKIAQVMEHAANRITELRQGIPTIEEVESEQEQVAEEATPSQEPASQQPTGGQVPSLEPAPHESSNINAFRYQPQTGKLYVKFQGKHPQQNGPVYSYEGVPKNIFEVFRRGAVAPKTSGRNAWHTWKKGVTPSHGAAMYALIREGGYPYQRLS